MTSPTREQVFAALFTQLKTAPGINTYSRRMSDYSAIPPGLLPCLILWEQPEETRYAGRQGLPVNTWEAVILIVFQNESKPHNGDPTTAVPGATIVNPLVDAVRAALAPDDISTNNYTVGGLVEWCRVEGKTVIETGDTDADGYGGAVIPLKILVPSQGGY
jgi:hypothetical protein